MAKTKKIKNKKKTEKNNIFVEAAVAETSSEMESAENNKINEMEESNEVDKVNKMQDGEPKKVKKKAVRAMWGGEKVITESSDEAREFYNQSRFGVISDSGKVELSLLEALYLMEKSKLEVTSELGRKITFETYIKKAKKIEPNFWIRYCVFKNMRNRGYIVKTALKFGADFRVYDRGVKPGEDHARWIIYPVHEGSVFTWYEFAAKNRVAHSTKKRLLIGIVDDEGDVTYYEIKWMRP